MNFSIEMEGETTVVEIEKKHPNVALTASLKFTIKHPEIKTKRFEVADEILQYEIAYVKALIIIIRVSDVFI